MKQKKHGRHAPAFILLAIACQPTHGLGILNFMNAEVPNNRLDTAIIYRTLKALEADGCIVSRWEESDAGPQKKVYAVTERGMAKLDEFRLEIEMSFSNLQRFMVMHDALKAD